MNNELFTDLPVKVPAKYNVIEISKGDISLYPRREDTINSKDSTIELFLNEIENEKYQDIILPLQAKIEAFNKKPRSDEETKIFKKEVNDYKATLPYVTTSGRFSPRRDSGIITHSSYIAIDIDHVDYETVKKRLRKSKFVYAIFRSCSGRGACVIFFIDGKRHLDAFNGIGKYVLENYGFVIDQACKDLSRPRFVSSDKNLYRNERAAKFTTYISREEKKEIPKKTPDTVFVEEDFKFMLSEIAERGLDITGSYSTWLNISFGFALKFGEAGRQYFHDVSQFSPTYNPEVTDRQFTNCLKSEGRDKLATIKTFYFLAKQAGLTTMSKRTREIVEISCNAKNGRATAEAAIKTLGICNIEVDETARDIVNQVFNGDISIDESGDIEAIEFWLKENHNLRKNLVTNNVENNGVALTDYEVNGIEIDLKRIFKKVEFGIISRIMNSKSIPAYNPIHDFFNRYKDRQPVGAIDEMASCIEATNDPEYVKKFFKKWMVGMIANIYEKKSKSPLVLALCGKQGSGKGFFFENLLPKELDEYYAMKDLSEVKNETAKRDLDILCSKKMLILDDEMSGKNKRDLARIKQLLSASSSDVRASYGKIDQKRDRIATFAATCNSLEILLDETGNRRYIPIEVLSIDKDRRDTIDLIDLLMEAYNLYRDGFDYRVLGNEIDELNIGTERFQAVSTEEELIAEHFRKPDSRLDPKAEYLTSTNIQIRLQDRHTSIKLDSKKIKAALAKIGIEQETMRVNGLKGRWFHVVDVYRTMLNPEHLEAIPY